jgi:hypothetical protein
MQQTGYYERFKIPTGIEMRSMQLGMTILLMVLVACSGDKTTTSPTIGMSKMADVLYDIAIAESYVEAYLSKDSSQNRDTLLKKEMDIVFNVHGIDSKVFAENLTIYKNQPERFQVILDSANERANRGRNEVFLRRVPKNANR